MRTTGQNWQLKYAQMSLEVASLGAVVTSWKIPGAHGATEILDGYGDSAQLQRGHGARNAIMVPWSNRIEDAKYFFNGVEYDFGPAADGSREAIHGLAIDKHFELVSISENAITLTATLGGEPAYPWWVRVTVTYTLFAAAPGYGLRCEIAQENLAPIPIMVGGGWHPYVRLQGEGAPKLRIDARASINVDSALIPLAGNLAFCPEKTPVELDDPHNLDRAYTDLVTDEEGTARAYLEHADGSRTVFEYRNAPIGRGVGILHAFTGETLTYRPREAFAVEPCYVMTNAFNRSECAQDLLLEPAGVRVIDSAIVHHVAAEEDFIRGTWNKALKATKGLGQLAYDGSEKTQSVKESAGKSIRALAGKASFFAKDATATVKGAGQNVYNAAETVAENAREITETAGKTVGGAAETAKFAAEVAIHDKKVRNVAKKGVKIAEKVADITTSF